MYLYFITSTHPYRVKIGIGNQLKRRVSQVDKTTKGQQRVLIAFDMPFGLCLPKRLKVGIKEFGNYRLVKTGQN